MSVNPIKRNEEEMKLNKSNLHISKGLNIWIKRLIACLQISGGVFGLILMYSNGYLSPKINMLSIFLEGLIISFYLFGIISGFALIEDKNIGIKLSMIFYAIQIPYITSFLLSFYLYCGFYLVIATNSPPDNSLSHFFCSYYISILQKDPFSVGINIAALTIFIILYRANMKLLKKKELPPKIYD